MLFGTTPISADTSPGQKNLSKPVQIIRTILSEVNSQTDLAKVKLTIDKIIDPTIDVDANLKQLNDMVRTIKRMSGVSATSMQKMLAVRKYIYESGQ